MPEDANSTPHRGLLMAVLAYGLWGLFPIYWKQVAGVPAVEVLAHRVFWSLVFIALVVIARKRLATTIAILRDRASRRALLLSTTLVALNWGLFIWAVSVDRVTEVSLGYYINPLLNVALGRIFLGETLSRRQAVAVGLATVAVGYLALARGGLPWVSLVVAGTFAWYGLVRKRAPVGALDGVAIETGLAAPVAAVYLALLDPPLGHLTTASSAVVALLIGSGVVTAIPLLAFIDAAQRLRYTTLGMVQYLAPTLQLGCAVLLYGEPFRTEHAVTFGLIWCAAGLYMADSLRSRRMALADAKSELEAGDHAARELGGGASCQAR